MIWLRWWWVQGAEVDAEGAGVQCVWNGGAERTAPLRTADRGWNDDMSSFLLLCSLLSIFNIILNCHCFLSVVVSPRCLFVLYNCSKYHTGSAELMVTGGSWWPFKYFKKDAFEIAKSTISSHCGFGLHWEQLCTFKCHPLCAYITSRPVSSLGAYFIWRLAGNTEILQTYLETVHRQAYPCHSALCKQNQL